MEKKNIHFIGIAGMSMRSLAEILLDKGCKVSGTDFVLPIGINSAIKCMIKKDFSQIPEDTDVVIYQKGVSLEHPEIIDAKNRNLLLIPRAKLLTNLTSDRFKILVTGTDGKTSTSFYAHQLGKMLNLDTFAIIGSAINKNKCYEVGSGPYVIEHNEADLQESVDSSDILVFTNFDGKDHIWCYDYNENLFFSLYKKLISNSKLLIYNYDDLNILKLLEDPELINLDKISFGRSEKADFQIKNIEETLENLNFELKYKEKTYLVKTQLNGKFSAYNVTAAIISMYQLNPNLERIIDLCINLKHAESRFEKIHEDAQKMIFSSLHNSGNSLAQVLESFKKYKKPISIVISIDVKGGDRAKVFFEEFKKAIEQYPLACLPNSYLADKMPNIFIIKNQEDFNEFINRIEGICIISHSKYCFHKYIKNLFPNFVSCFEC